MDERRSLEQLDRRAEEREPLDRVPAEAGRHKRQRWPDPLALGLQHVPYELTEQRDVDFVPDRVHQPLNAAELLPQAGVEVGDRDHAALLSLSRRAKSSLSPKIATAFSRVAAAS